jgi:hypothetical protein
VAELSTYCRRPVRVSQLPSMTQGRSSRFNVLDAEQASGLGKAKLSAVAWIARNPLGANQVQVGEVDRRRMEEQVFLAMHPDRGRYGEVFSWVASEVRTCWSREPMRLR